MKRSGVVLVLFLLVFAAAAQTNPSLVATNMVAGGRSLSLQDCIREALKHNLDVQIQRYNPEIYLYNLRASYGGYDPTFSFSGAHDFNVQPGGFFDGLPLPSETTKEDTFNSSLGGELPFSGLQYDFGTGNTPFNQYYFLKYNTNNAPVRTEENEGSIGVTLTQPLLKNFWIDKTRLTIKLNKNQLQNGEQAFREQVITSITAVQNAYYELIYALENLKVQDEALKLSQTQLDQDKQRVQIGTLTELSMEQDESQVAQNQANVITAQSTLETDQNTLKNLITDNYPAWHATDIQPTETLTAPLELFDLQDSWSRGLTGRPDLLQARLNVEKDGIELKFDRNQLFPELDVIGTYGWNGAGYRYNDTFSQINQGSAPYYSVGGQLSIPLANQNARNQVKADKATLKQVVLQLKQFEQNVMVEIDNAVKTAQSDYESVNATRQARIYAEAALDAEQQTYDAQKATTFEVLTYQNNLTAARGQEIRALANYEEALANLYAQEGSTLERLGVNIESN